MPHHRFPFLLTTQEAGRVLECKRQRIQDLCVAGKLHPVRLGGRLYFHLADLMRYATSRAPVDLNAVEARLLEALGIRARLIFSAKNGQADHLKALGGDWPLPPEAKEGTRDEPGPAE